MKINLLLVFLLFILNANLLSAQTTFQKAYGGTGESFGTDMIQTFDGGFLLAGYTNGFGTGNHDGYLIKTNAGGDILWTKTYGDTANEQISSVKQTTDSGYIFTGFTTSFGAGGQDVYIVKTDNDGSPVWQRTFGGTNDDAGAEVRQTRDGGYIVVGYNTSLGTDSDRVNGVYVIKLDANGDSLWTKVYAGQSLTTSDAGNSIYQTNDGGYIITGSGTQVDSSDADVYLLKIDSTGTVLWDRYIGGSGNDGGSSVQQTRDHGFIITGTTNSFGAGSNDAYLIKTDSTGAITWSKTYGGASEDEGIYGQQTNDGGYFVIGESGSFGNGIKSFYFIKTDANGDTLWTQAYGGASIFLGISGKQTTDGGYALVGYDADFPFDGVLNMYLVKTDSDGVSNCSQAGTSTLVDTGTSSFVSPAISASTGGIVSTPASTINSGGNSFSPCSTLSVNEIKSESGISIYPNPVRNQFTVYGFQLRQGATMIIYNVLGEVLKTKSGNFNEEAAVDVKDLATGIYFIRIADDKHVWVGRFVKE